MGLRVGWMAGHMKSGGVGVRVGESASEGGGTYLGRGSTTRVVGWHGVILGMGESASEGRGEEEWDLLGRGWIRVGVTWQHGEMSGRGASLVCL